MGYLIGLKIYRQWSRAKGFQCPSAPACRDAHRSRGQDRQLLIRGLIAHVLTAQLRAQPPHRPAELQRLGAPAATSLPGSPAGPHPNYAAVSRSELCLREDNEGAAVRGTSWFIGADANSSSRCPDASRAREGSWRGWGKLRQQRSVGSSSSAPKLYGQSWKLRMGETGFLQDSPSAA